MSGMSVNEAQCFVLSAAFTDDAAVFAQIKPDMLDDPFRGWAHVIEAVHQRYGRVTPEDYIAECQRRGTDPSITRWYRGTIPTDEAAAAFASAASRERLVEALLRAKQRADSGAAVDSIADELVEAMGAIPRASDDEHRWHTFDEVRSMEGEFAEWVVPDLLRHGTRCVLTGGEGWGKSTLLYQIAFGAAFGVDPLGGDATFDPQRVFVLDVENWHETQVRQHYHRMEFAYRKATNLSGQPAIALDKTRHIDLLNASERRALVSATDRFQPDLVVMGSGYKLVAPVGDWRLEAQAVMNTADEIRAKTGASVLIETHAGHGMAGDRNGWRPDGSSYWLRWPEFGLGLEPRQARHANGRRLLQVHRWRGDRDTGASWPYGWKSSTLLPWVPCEREEFEQEALPKNAHA